MRGAGAKRQWRLAERSSKLPPQLSWAKRRLSQRCVRCSSTGGFRTPEDRHEAVGQTLQIFEGGPVKRITLFFIFGTTCQFEGK